MLRLKNQVYLDYTGSGLYRDSQIDDAANNLKNVLYGNNHGQSECAKTTDTTIMDARSELLKFLNTSPEDFTTVFTKCATGALHTISEIVPWTNGSYFIYLRQNHNSVLGMRYEAIRDGAKIAVVDENNILEQIKKLNLDKTKTHVFAYPAEENFSGMKYPLEWIDKLHELYPNMLVVVDFAAYLPTSPINFNELNMDFAVLSFYKIFGYPTGVGALIINNSVLDKLVKKHWGGGSVISVLLGKNYQLFPKDPTRKYEDGTPDFLGIASLKYGYKALESVGGMESVYKHTSCVRMYLYDKLSSLRHSNGRPLLEIYGKHNTNLINNRQGPIITFNISIILL